MGVSLYVERVVISRDTAQAVGEGMGALSAMPVGKMVTLQNNAKTEGGGHQGIV